MVELQAHSTFQLISRKNIGIFEQIHSFLCPPKLDSNFVIQSVNVNGTYICGRDHFESFLQQKEAMYIGAVSWERVIFLCQSLLYRVLDVRCRLTIYFSFFKVCYLCGLSGLCFSMCKHFQ